MPILNRRTERQVAPEGHYIGTFEGIEQRTVHSVYRNAECEINIYMFRGRLIEESENTGSVEHDCVCVVNNSWGKRSRQYELLSRMAGKSTIKGGMIVTEPMEIPNQVLDELDKHNFTQWIGASFIWQVVHKTKHNDDGTRTIRDYVPAQSVLRPAGEPSLLEIHANLKPATTALENDPFAVPDEAEAQL